MYKDISFKDIYMEKKTFKAYKYDDFIRNMIFRSFSWFIAVDYLDFILFKENTDISIEKVFDLLDNNSPIYKRLDKIIYRNKNNEVIGVSSFMYDDKGYPKSVTGPNIDIEICKYEYIKSNKTVYFIHDNFTNENFKMLNITKNLTKGNEYETIELFTGLRNLDKENNQMPHRIYKVYRDLIYKNYCNKYICTYDADTNIIESITSDEVIIESNRWGDIFIYSLDRRTRYNSDGMVDYALDGISGAILIYGEMIFAYTHFDSNGIPYKALRIDGGRSAEYDVITTEELYYTDEHPEGEKLIKSVRSCIDPSEEIIILRDLNNGKYLATMNEFSFYPDVNDENVEYAYINIVYTFNSWRELLDVRYYINGDYDTVKFLYEFKMVDDDLIHENIVNKQYHKINIYGETIKKVKVIKNKMSISEENIRKDFEKI